MWPPSTLTCSASCAEQRIDAAAGFTLHVARGARVSRGAPLLTIHAAKGSLIEQVRERAQASFTLRRAAPKRTALVLERVR